MLCCTLQRHLQRSWQLSLLREGSREEERVLRVGECVCVLDRFAGCINGKETGDQKAREKGPCGNARVQFAGGPWAHSKQRVCWWSGAVWGAAAAELFPSQLSSIKHSDRFRISGRKVCGHNAFLAGVAADGKARAVVGERFHVRWFGLSDNGGMIGSSYKGVNLYYLSTRYPPCTWGHWQESWKDRFPLRHHTIFAVLWLIKRLRSIWEAFPSLRRCSGALSALLDYCLPPFHAPALPQTSWHNVNRFNSCCSSCGLKEIPLKKK